jgi:hypothetical protein
MVSLLIPCISPKVADSDILHKVISHKLVASLLRIICLSSYMILGLDP